MTTAEMMEARASALSIGALGVLSFALGHELFGLWLIVVADWITAHKPHTSRSGDDDAR